MDLKIPSTGILNSSLIPKWYKCNSETIPYASNLFLLWLRDPCNLVLFCPREIEFLWDCWNHIYLPKWNYVTKDIIEWLHFHFLLACIGERNGNPLQCSCLQNPRDRRAWWAAVCGVTESRTRLKWLSSSKRNYVTKDIIDSTSCPTF